jgi:hypothetical protein
MELDARVPESARVWSPGPRRKMGLRRKLRGCVVDGTGGRRLFLPFLPSAFDLDRRKDYD